MARFNKGDIVTIMDVPANRFHSTYSKRIGTPLEVTSVTSDTTFYNLPDGKPGGCCTSRLEHFKINLENE